MKTKAEILKMSKGEIEEYAKSLKLRKLGNKNCSECFDCTYCSECSDCSYCSKCFECSNCSNCSDCFDCIKCSECFDCSHCLNCSECFDCTYCFKCFDCTYCSQVKNLKYAICNIEMTQEEYEIKMKSLWNGKIKLTKEKRKNEN